ncbi:MAG: hypothetical protein R3F50_02985 [Gammaproteobacteria bacterium]
MNKSLATLAFIALTIQPSVYAQDSSVSMQEHMERMMSLMAEIKSEQNSGRLAELRSQHMELMHEGMQMLDKSDTSGSDMSIEARIAKNEQKMEFMQMMMSQMMDHQDQERRRPIHEHKR